jgi:transcription-repair coupling factor (superfamily II helicase)
MSSPFKGGQVFEAEDSAFAPALIKIFHTYNRPVLCVFPELGPAEDTYIRIKMWSSALGLNVSALFLPETMAMGGHIAGGDTQKAAALHKALVSPALITVSSVSAVFSAAPAPSRILDSSMGISPGMNIGVSELLGKLAGMDYDDELQAVRPGEFSRRGGIVDIFSPSEAFPARLEFFGDTVESLRRFDPETQRSVSEIKHYTVIPSGGSDEGDHCFFDHMETHKPVLAVVNPAQCSEHLKKFFAEDIPRRWERALESVKAGRPESLITFLDAAEAASLGVDAAGSGCYPPSRFFRAALPEGSTEASARMAAEISAGTVREWLASGYTVPLVSSRESPELFVRDWMRENGIPANSRALIDAANIPSGIIVPEIKLAVLHEKELFTLTPRRRLADAAGEEEGEKTGAAAPEKAAWDSDFSELCEGDYAVHLARGVCVFRGIKEIESEGASVEVFELEFADDSVLYAPVWQADMISRYVGAGKASPALSKLGGKRWAGARDAAAKAVREMALDIIRLEAARAAAPGFKYPEDDLEQKAFEEAFPFAETPDQARASFEIKRDMSQPKPMDRLLCGDVGFGKTEVAMRAIFKAVMSGRQAAVLVPTTILAQQHFLTMTERFAEHPFNIEMLCRFVSPAGQRDVLDRLAEGKVDIVIGTHRLVQNDVRFKDLGFVVIDEEQRFGVTHKERLKKLRTMVDVLTMTATPIPRTLHMALTGIRSLSAINTPPVSRLPVRTIVAAQSDHVIVQALENEIQRGGQAFYLHNRVKTIDETCARLRKLCPFAKFAVAHGQMDDEDLESVMGAFINGKTDVLVCTTIIESGLDIPNANTMIIERCDRFGLAELYQLRGRIGRWTRQAHAYMLVPKDEILSSDARKRVSAIRHYTHLGAGLKLALRDLEIRGAGSLLGADQSGHINAIGFDLYCQLLKNTVASLRGETVTVPPETSLSLDFLVFGHKAPAGKAAAGFPPSYMSSEQHRIEAYRKLARISNLEDAAAFSDDLRDRFGMPPPQTAAMIKTAKIRIAAQKAGIKSVAVADNKIILTGRPGGPVKIRGAIPTLRPNASPVKKLDALLDLMLRLAAEPCVTAGPSGRI